jgi:starch synthase
MNVVFASSEAFPFFVTDGHGIMAGQLPPAIKRRRAETSVILPLYSDLAPEFRSKLRFVQSFNVPVGWRNQYCGLFVLEWQEVTWYFLDNEYYFKRKGLYGFFDDGERFAFFARAVLETLESLELVPDILHCHDWQTALVPVYFNIFYRNQKKYTKLHTVHTLHDIGKQCTYGTEILEDTYGINRDQSIVLEYGGIVNLAKGAIETAEAVTVLSPSYLYEIIEPPGGHGLEEFLQKKRQKLKGITCGIDFSRLNPLTDSQIEFNYGLEDATQGKAICKHKLRELSGLRQSEAPVLVIVTGVVNEGLGILPLVIEDLVGSGLQVAVVGLGVEKYAPYLEGVKAHLQGDIGVFSCTTREEARAAYAGGDILLVTSDRELCGYEHMTALRYGCVPVAHAAGSVPDTIHKYTGHMGNGFLFKPYDAAQLLKTCREMVSVYQDKTAWSALVTRAMSADNSWASCARKYMDLYGRVTTGEWR